MSLRELLSRARDALEAIQEQTQSTVCELVTGAEGFRDDREVDAVAGLMTELDEALQPVEPRAGESIRDVVIRTIALEELGLETLETRGNDRLDFHDLNAASVKAALTQAFDDGARAGAALAGGQ